MPAIDRLEDKLRAGLKLRGRAVIPLKAQARVAADLPQLGELSQNLELFSLELFTHLVLNLKREAILGGEIELPLLGFHLRIDDAFGLFGKVGKDLGLETTEDEGTDRAAKQVRGIVLAGLDGALVTLGELVARPEVAGHEEIENAPKLRQAILDRRSRQGEAHVGIKALRALSDLRFRILYILGLIKNHAREVTPRVNLDIASQQVI